MDDPMTLALRRPWPPDTSDPFTSVEECRAAAEHLASTESEVENDREQVDWEATFDRLEAWYRLHLPSDTDDERYRVMRAAIRKARRPE